MYKKNVDVDKLPPNVVEGLEISGVSKIKNLTALAREKEEQSKKAQIVSVRDEDGHSIQSFDNDSLGIERRSKVDSQGNHIGSVFENNLSQQNQTISI